MKKVRYYIFTFITILIFVNCNKEVPSLLDPDGYPQNSSLNNTISTVYTRDGTKLDLFVYNGDFPATNEFFNKQLEIVMDYSGNPLTHDFEPSSSYMELTSIGNSEYMKITSWVAADKNGWTMWGAVIKSEGNNNFGFRDTVDLSQYSKIVFDIKCDPDTPIPDNCLKISVKDSSDADWGGAETKLSINGITSEWQTMKFDLSSITTLSNTRVFLLFEFVLDAGTPTGKYIYYIDNVGFIK